MLTDAQKAAILRVFDALWELKNARGRPIAEPFGDLPDKNAWREYYRVIPHPKSLNGVKESLENGGYSTLQAVLDDLLLVFNNALHFNEDGSVINNDARTLKATLESTWQADPDLTPPRPATPVRAAPTPAGAPFDDIEASPVGDASPVGATGETNWESMKPRDKAGDEMVRRVETLLPRWKGPSLEGWMNLEGAAARDPYKVYADIMNKLKTIKDKGADTLVSDALSRISETAVLPEMSFTAPMSLALIENRIALRGYPAPKDFDMDMARLFEKGRRWFEAGSKDYGRILILQRVYQGLTSSSAASAALTRTASQNYASIPAGPGFAKPLHSVGSTSQDAVTTYRIQNKDRTFTEEITFKGMTYRSGDYVHLMNPNDASRPIVGQVFKLWIPDNGTPGERGIAVCWYFRPEQTFHPPQRPFWEHEIFKTGHFADHAMEDIMEKVGCQFMTRHIRGRPKAPMWYPNWPLYVCDSRYNDRDRVFVRIKNWNSCIPDELRKADFMPILPFEKTVMPRKVDSPFLHGVKGPGGLMEEDELRRKSKRAAERTARSSAAPALDITSAADAGAKAEVVPTAGGVLATEAKPPADRSLTVAAGGRAALGGDPTIEMLPEETIQLFDRDPRTGEVLWFSGPPIQAIKPEAFRPQYSLEYLAFLAKKKAAAEKERVRREEEEEMDTEMDGEDDEDGQGRRKRLRSDSTQESRPVARPTLLESLSIPYEPAPASG